MIEHFNKLKIISLLFVVFTAFASCKKEEQLELTGSVTLRFVNYSSIDELNVFKPKIYGYVEPFYDYPPIVSDITINSHATSGEIKLNMGNYICEYSEKTPGTYDSYTGRIKAFQVYPGEHLELIIDLK
ncbi:hypothetical protein DMA11_04150 [Marinilabiliaceae bacterium JC017]|nr:hypothetical protein DMA11_04150 [Marinilabiliaceae bacterium JC017]